MLSVTTKSGQTHLHVDLPVLAERWTRLHALTSDLRAPNIAADPQRWEEGLAWSIADRLRNGGDRKGRALAIWQEPREGPPTALAVLAWHREDAGPFYLFDLGARIDLAEKARSQLQATLLKIMLDASAHPAARIPEEWQKVLRWATVQFKRAPNAVRKPYAKAAIGRARALDFERHRPPPAAPRNISRSWLGERRF